MDQLCAESTICGCSENRNNGQEESLTPVNLLPAKACLGDSLSSGNQPPKGTFSLSKVIQVPGAWKTQGQGHPYLQGTF